MSHQDSAPLARLDAEETELSDENDSGNLPGDSARCGRKKFTLNDYSCSYIDNSAACSLMNTPQRVIRRPTTPKHLAASFDDDSSLTGSLRDLVVGFDNTVQHFTSSETADAAGESLVVSALPRGASHSKRDGTMWWSLISEVPISENRDQENLCEFDGTDSSTLLSKCVNVPNISLDGAEAANRIDSKSELPPSGSSDEELEVQLDTIQWNIDFDDADADAEQLTRTADEAITEIECMLDDQQVFGDGAGDVEGESLSVNQIGSNEESNEDEDGVEFESFPDAATDANVGGNMCAAMAMAAEIERELADYRRRVAAARSGNNDALGLDPRVELATLSSGALRALCAEQDATVASLNTHLVALLAERDELEFEKETFDRFISLLNELEHQQRLQRAKEHEQSSRADESVAHDSRLHRRSVCVNEQEQSNQQIRVAADDRSAGVSKRRSFSIQGLSSLFTAANWSVLKSPSSASGSSACASHSSMTQSATVATGLQLAANSGRGLTSTHMPTPTALLSPMSTSTSVHEGLIQLAASANSCAKHIPILIPPACRHRPPTITELQRLNAVLAAIRDDSSQVPALLADYILNVYVPRNSRTYARSGATTTGTRRRDTAFDSCHVEFEDIGC